MRVSVQSGSAITFKVPFFEEKMHQRKEASPCAERERSFFQEVVGPEYANANKMKNFISSEPDPPPRRRPPPNFSLFF